MTPNLPAKRKRLWPHLVLADPRKKYSCGEIAEMIGVDRKTVYRWLNTKRISPCYALILDRLGKEGRCHKVPGKANPGTLLQILERLRHRSGSWDKLARRLSVPKKTIMRWRASGNISPGYRHILEISDREFR